MIIIYFFKFTVRSVAAGGQIFFGGVANRPGPLTRTTTPPPPPHSSQLINQSSDPFALHTPPLDASIGGDPLALPPPPTMALLNATVEVRGGGQGGGALLNPG